MPTRVKNNSEMILKMPLFKDGKYAERELKPGEIGKTKSTDLYMCLGNTHVEEVNEPTKRYLSNWAIGIGCAIIGAVVGVALTILFIK